MDDENNDVIKSIDGVLYYKYDYTDFLYQKLEDFKSRVDKAIKLVETNPLIWKPNMELTNLIENPNLKDMLYYKPDEWLHKLHTILEGDDEK